MPGNPIPEVPDSASGVLWAVVIAGALFMARVFNYLLKVATSKRTTKIDQLEEGLDDVRREQRRESRRIDRLETYTPGLERLTEDGRDD